MVVIALAQDPPRPIPRPDDTEDVKMPNGKSQRDAIAKADQKKNVEDAAELVRLSQAIQEDLERDGEHVVSVKTLKELDDIERLSKRIRGRLKRF